MAHKAGLPVDSSPHGLRNAICRHLAEAGCSSAQIMAITGQSLSVFERHIRDASRKVLTRSGTASIKDGIVLKKPEAKTG